jgi:predicted RNase H-like nuclease
MGEQVMGVDGCPGGFVAVCRDAAGGAARAWRVDRFAGLVVGPDRPAVIAVDMPIGLPERTRVGGRGPEALVRPLLGQRQSSVFAIPSRAAVHAADYGEACRLALATSDPPRKVSKQAFFLFPKIIEIDRLLVADAGLRDTVHECHPEVAFMLMNGGRPLETPKKVKSRVNEAGMRERIALLAGRAGFDPQFLGRPPKGVGPDDLLDAAACCHAAGRWLRGEARGFPEVPERDRHGIAMRIMA